MASNSASRSAAPPGSPAGSALACVRSSMDVEDTLPAAACWSAGDNGRDGASPGRRRPRPTSLSGEVVQHLRCGLAVSSPGASPGLPRLLLDQDQVAAVGPELRVVDGQLAADVLALLVQAAGVLEVLGG